MAAEAWQTISAPSPYRACAERPPGMFENAEVEPSIAVAPAGANTLVAVFQQDRFSRGAARGLAAGFSHNGGGTWSNVELPFSLCATTPNTGWAYASDPWVSLGPDGRAYVVGIGPGLAASVSPDGGAHWSEPVTLAVTTATGFIDKGTVTADPARAGVAYAVWQRYLVTPHPPPVASDTLLAVTRDGGRHWTKPTLVLRHAANAGDVASVILVDAQRHVLFHLAYWQAGGLPGPGRAHESLLLVQRSRDGGRHWSTPTRIARIQAAPARLRDPASGKTIRPGAPSFALDTANGALYAAWQDTRFSNGRHDDIAYSRSLDGGRTWSAPRRMNEASDAAAIVPVVAAGDGAVAVSYYALTARREADGADCRFTIVSAAGGKTFTRRSIGPSFRLADAPLLAGDRALLVPAGLFLGDYSGLAMRDHRIYAAFATTNHTTANRTDIRFVTRTVR